MTHFFIFLFALGLTTIAGCKRDDIQTYNIPKETPSPSPGRRGDHPLPSGDGKGEAEIEWKVPTGWQEQTPSAMRLGSFLIKGENGQADMSVVPLSGDAGGDLANINRWRGQISLSPISEGDLSQQSEALSLAGRRMLFVNFANQGKRLMAAVYHRGDRTWFFKMTGDDTAVQAAKPALMQFLKSLKFHETPGD